MENRTNIPTPEAFLKEEQPVILLEGRRNLPPGIAEQLTQTGKWLAEQFPKAIFRSGNAEGSDTSFSNGVVSVDPSRMQYLLPTPNMGKKRRHSDSPCFSLADLTELERENLGEISVQASPSSKRLVHAATGRIPNARLAAKGNYLLRDTFKVMGSQALKLATATHALFFVQLHDPDVGGTGHTIRVCRNQNIPVLFQDIFLQRARE